ncbi:DUF559 domain-containing protein [Micromonospora sp. CPCC 205546]|uniref:DUF559 domain-containing protein n=1 Tax=Micromonospora sp. CPCC 205546 TaxID=3122397 RepID=UPI002FF211DD
MNSVLRALVDRNGGLVSRRDASQVLPRWVLEDASRSGRLLRLLPGVYVDAALVDGAEGAPPLARVAPVLARRAAVAYAGGRGALSHLSALDVWRLRRQPPGEPVHLNVPTGAGLRSGPHLVVHYRRSFAPEPPHALIRDGVPVTRLDRTLVDAWPLLSPVDRPATLIRAVNDRLTTPQRIVAELTTAPKLPDRAALRRLLDRLAAGCRSPLEIWGHDHVFVGPGMPPFQRQVRVRLGGRIAYLDLFAETELVDIELDGATTHADLREREIDLRRDALLAARGVLVVRFSHRRLLHEPDEVRRETLAVLAARRRQDFAPDPGLRRRLLIE